MRERLEQKENNQTKVYFMCWIIENKSLSVLNMRAQNIHTKYNLSSMCLDLLFMRQSYLVL